ncbi:MAG: hypothetical protein FK733_01595 [Asgard group archaeon]|nr:hypothetical protein [Asgard group archaeon]
MTLNIKEVTLYQSGVGFFNADCPKKLFVLPVNETDINDVLKSLSVDGLKSVRFSSAEELDFVLNKIGIDFESDGTLLSIIQHLIGLEVKVTTDKEFLGIVVGVDDIEDDSKGSKAKIKNEVLVLKVKDLVQNIPLNTITNLELLDPVIQKDINAYLDLIANKRKAGVINLHIDAKENSWATWVMPVSSWRLSYRAFYDRKTSELDLYGISVIDNTTSIDWESVVLRLVTGKPVSFQYDLFTPLFMKRPEIARDVKGIAPILSEASGAFDDFDDDAIDEIGDMAYDKSDGVARFASGAPGAAPPKPMAKRAKMRSMSMKGEGVMGMVGDMPVTAEEAKPTIEAMKLELGSAIAYEISYPVTLTRSKSALIPILNEKLKGKLCVILRDDRLNEPMDAIELEKPLELEKGAATVYLDNSYAGDSMIVKGTEYFAFRLNQDLSIMRDISTSHKIQTVVIEGVNIKIQETTTKTYTYKFVNRDEEIIPMILEHTKEHNYTPKTKPVAETKNYDRYSFDIKQGNSKLTLTYKATHYQYHLIKNLSKKQIEEYHDKGYLSGVEKRRINHIIELLRNVQKLRQELEKTSKAITHQFTNQKRIRENLKAVKDDDTLRKEYLHKLTVSEQTLAQLLEEENRLMSEIKVLSDKLEK